MCQSFCGRNQGECLTLFCNWKQENPLVAAYFIFYFSSSLSYLKLSQQNQITQKYYRQNLGKSSEKMLLGYALMQFVHVVFIYSYVHTTFDIIATDAFAYSFTYTCMIQALLISLAHSCLTTAYLTEVLGIIKA